MFHCATNAQTRMSRGQSLRCHFVSRRSKRICALHCNSAPLWKLGTNVFVLNKEKDRLIMVWVLVSLRETQYARAPIMKNKKEIMVLQFLYLVVQAQLSPHNTPPAESRDRPHSQNRIEDKPKTRHKSLKQWSCEVDRGLNIDICQRKGGFHIHVK